MPTHGYPLHPHFIRSFLIVKSLLRRVPRSEHLRIIWLRTGSRAFFFPDVRNCYCQGKSQAETARMPDEGASGTRTASILGPWGRRGAHRSRRESPQSQETGLKKRFLGLTSSLGPVWIVLNARHSQKGSNKHGIACSTFHQTSPTTHHDPATH